MVALPAMADRTSADGCWYFAYGSNMQRATFVERRGMRPLAIRRAHLDDHRLCFDLPIGPGERGVANLQPEPGARTWGVAYLLTADACRLLSRS
jgi:cation transport regulator ChaC